jgi:hypothetical protein
MVRVDAQGGVGFSVAESALHVDDGDVECDQHAGVAVAQVVQAWLGRGDAGRVDGTLERRAGDLAFEAGAVSAREHERGRVEQGAARGDEREQARTSTGRTPRYRTCAR